jgi:hypothetical protein
MVDDCEAGPPLDDPEAPLTPDRPGSLCDRNDAASFIMSWFMNLLGMDFTADGMAL